MKKSLDVLILFALVIARIRIDTLADVAALPQRHEDVRRLVESWWPAWSLDLLSTYPETDPVSMMLIVTAIGLLIFYVAVDFFSDAPQSGKPYRLKVFFLYGIIGLLIVGKIVLLINLRHLQGPVSYAHDGGVIQTEITIDYFLNGLNPYIEDYVDTPMAEWGNPEYRTALYHYPYLPWTFVFSAPFYLLSQALIGWFDQRMVYLPVFIITLVLVHNLIKNPQAKLIAIAVIGLNPIGGVSLIFGENDPFVFGWIVLALWLLQLDTFSTSKFEGTARPVRLRSARRRAKLLKKLDLLSLTPARRSLLASAAFGLACASKPTAWFLAPFWLLYLLRDQWGDYLIPAISRWLSLFSTVLHRAWTLPVVALFIIGPWFVWNPDAMYDDVWRWSAGQGSTGYQIWGWGASNYVLGLGLVKDRFEYWPFIIPGFIITAPLLALLLWRQIKANTLSTMLYGYVLLLFAFFYVSRFLQPNYLGYMLGFLALAMMMNEEIRD